MKKRAKSKEVVYELKPGQPLTARQKREIQALAAMPEDTIDTSDIPELPPGAWKNAVRGKWYRPVKQAVSIRLDADVLAWPKDHDWGNVGPAANRSESPTGGSSLAGWGTGVGYCGQVSGRETAIINIIDLRIDILNL